MRDLTKRSWESMMARCSNPRHVAYRNYGGRGITVCEQWHVFTSFRQDMGERPSADHSLERIRNADGYCPGNCRWATRKEQMNNRRNNHRITVRGEVMTIAQASMKFGVPYHAIHSRIQKGVDETVAATTPSTPRALRRRDTTAKLKLVKAT